MWVEVKEIISTLLSLFYFKFTTNTKKTHFNRMWFKRNMSSRVHKQPLNTHLSGCEGRTRWPRPSPCRTRPSSGPSCCWQTPNPHSWSRSWVRWRTSSGSRPGRSWPAFQPHPLWLWLCPCWGPGKDIVGWRGRGVRRNETAHEKRKRGRGVQFGSVTSPHDHDLA